jgi:hypothetical protein
MPNNTKPRKAKVRKLTKDNIFTSVAIASIVCNILLLCIVYVATRPDTVDYALYNGIRSHFCSNKNAYNNLLKTADKNGESRQTAQEKYELACNSGNFAPYYQQAVSSYEQAQNKK